MKSIAVKFGPGGDIEMTSDGMSEDEEDKVLPGFEEAVGRVKSRTIVRREPNPSNKEAAGSGV